MEYTRGGKKVQSEGKQAALPWLPPWCYLPRIRTAVHMLLRLAFAVSVQHRNSSKVLCRYHCNSGEGKVSCLGPRIAAFYMMPHRPDDL